jgi:WD40 repeat protein
MAEASLTATRTTHLLPFLSLSPADFERLCLALVHREGYERPEHFGAAPPDGGRDIVAFRNGRRVVFQCKRCQRLGPKDADAVVGKILSLPEPERPDELILIATCLVSSQARQRARERAGAIDLQVWALTELDERVQRHAALVSQFFDLRPPAVHPEPATQGAVTAVPRLPPHFLYRPDDLASIKRVLLERDAAHLAVPGTRHAVGVHGMGGIGKSVLAAALALDEEVVRAFPDGVFWVALGQKPNLVRVQVELAAAAGEVRLVLDSLHQGKFLLTRLFAKRNVLLVLDDVWSLDAVAAFDVVGDGGRLLLTTRDADLLVGLGAAEHRVEVLTADQALGFLADWAGHQVKDLPPISAQVAQRCGYLPLALAIIGALVRLRPTGWTEALDRLERIDLARLQRSFPDYPYPNLLRCFEVSLDALSLCDRERYLELAVFPKHAAVPEAVLETLWASAGLADIDARDLAGALVARSLVQRDAEGSLRLHDLLADYLRHQAGDLRRLHTRLIDAYAARYPQGFASGHSDGYYFQQLPSHLYSAGRLSELRDLLLDFRWLEAKLAATGVNALLSDYEAFLDDPDLRHVRGALRLSAHALADCSQELPGQLHGRLLRSSKGMVALLNSAIEAPSHCWLRPRTSSLMLSGGPLRQTLVNAEGAAAVTALPDGRRIVTGHDDGTLRVWDIDSGESQIIGTHDKEIVAIAAQSDARVVTVSKNRLLLVWSLGSGQILHALEGHHACAVTALPDGSVALSNGDDVQVWDVESGQVSVLIPSKYTGHLRALAPLPDCRILVTADTDGYLGVWDLGSGSGNTISQGHRLDVATLPSGRIISVGGRVIRIDDFNSISEATRYLLGGIRTFALAALPGGRIVSAVDDRMLRVWDLASRQTLNVLEGHAAHVRAVASMPDGHIVSCSYDGTLRIWDPASKQSRNVLEGHSEAVSAVVALSDGCVVSASFDDATLRLWDPHSGQTIHTIESSDGIRALAALPDDRIVIVSSFGGLLQLCDPSSGMTHTLCGHPQHIQVVAPMPDGRVITGCSDGTLRVWNLELDTGQTVHTFDRSGKIAAVAALPYGCIAAVHGDTLCVCDLTSGQILQALEGYWVSAMTALADGRIVAAFEDGTLRVWCFDPEQCLLTLEERLTAPVHALALLPHSRVVAASGDGAVRVWDLDSGRVMARLTLDAPPTAVACVLSNRLAVGDSLGHIHLLQVERGAQRRDMR